MGSESGPLAGDLQQEHDHHDCLPMTKLTTTHNARLWVHLPLYTRLCHACDMSSAVRQMQTSIIVSYCGDCQQQAGS